MKKKVQVKRLPTSDATDVVNTILEYKGNIIKPLAGGEWRRYVLEGASAYHLYFLSYEKPKKGDWVIDEDDDVCILLGNDPNDIEGCKKIVATTDQKLIKDGVDEIGVDFIKLYAERCGIDEVELHYTNNVYSHEEKLYPNGYKLKLNHDNTVVWSLVEEEKKKSNLIFRLMKYLKKCIVEKRLRGCVENCIMRT